MKTGETISFEAVYVENPEPPPLPKIGDVISFGGDSGAIDCYCRVVAAEGEPGGVQAWQLSEPYADAACTIPYERRPLAGHRGDCAKVTQATVTGKTDAACDCRRD